MIKAIIFDFYGVFTPDNYYKWLEAHVKDLDTQKGFFRSLSKELDTGRISENEFLQTVEKRTGLTSEIMKTGFGREVLLDRELINFVKELKTEYKIALISNAFAGWLNYVLDKMNIREIFDVVVISSEVGFVKPEPEIFDITLTKLGLNKQEVLFIDDKPKFVTAGEGYGIKGLVYTNVQNLAKDLKALQGN